MSNNTVVPVTEFTFHYVSIKSALQLIQALANAHLHSTMYLLNPPQTHLVEQTSPNLHSTMYLLNPVDYILDGEYV